MPPITSPEAFGDHIESKMHRLLSKVEESDVYQRVFAPEADPKLILTVIKYVLLEVFSYGPHVTEATFTAIGRIRKDRPDLMKIMINHDLEEVDHGEMALKDFIRLGGSESWARARRLTPASWAMGATCRLIAETQNPFAYLGYMYPFESMTPILTSRVLSVLEKKGFPAGATGFIQFHAEEDIAHAKMLRTLIERVVRDYPEAAEAIDWAFDCFACVYPLPVWQACLDHASIELGAK